MNRITNKTGFLFAVKEPVDQAHIFVEYEQDGYIEVLTPDEITVWNAIYKTQTDEQRTSALSASMFGWEKPIAFEAHRAVARYFQSKETLRNKHAG